ncbi:MAG: hypothetical protein J4G15_01940 [Alphaproteobacteria bacterium]|nr:hypothetical protein [Alphaproteobacteria bacterium]
MPWQRDTTASTVSVMLQAPLAGGEFEYVHGLRTEDHDDDVSLGRVLSGERTHVTTVPITPGALMLFAGTCSTGCALFLAAGGGISQPCATAIGQA